MKKIFFSALFLIQCIVSAYAVQAKPGISTVTQPDGYQLSTLLRGDETFNFYSTTDQYVLLQDAEGYFVYAIPNAAGVLTPSAIRAHNVADRSGQEISFLQTITPNLPFGEAVSKTVKSRSLQQKALISGNRSQVKNSTIGSPNYLVLLVEFNDTKFLTTSNLARFQDQLNGTNYTTDGATGSMKKYYSDNSMSQFTPNFNVHGPFTLTKDASYYGQNSSSGNDLHADEMVTEACVLADLSGVDFSQYDANNDGEVDNVYIIFAGKGAAAGGGPSTIWPQAGAVNYDPKLDNKTLRIYGCSSELNYGGTLDGIGTMCHEFGHILGLPDFYDTDYATNGQAYGAGPWCLMGSGAYNNGGKTPPYFLGIERELLNWGSPTMITTGSTYTLNPISSNQYFRINTPTSNEYYLFENRQQTGWDAYIPGHGMLVYHVDKSGGNSLRWQYNTINVDASHECMGIIPAGGSTATNAEASIPFPGTSLIKNITKNTTPSLKSWAGVDIGKEFLNITEANSNITFQLVNTSDLLSVQANAATNIGSTSFTANWTAANSTTTLLNVYKKAALGSSTQDFESGSITSPWVKSGDLFIDDEKVTFETNSLYFSTNDDYITTGNYPYAIRNISYKTRTDKGEDGNMSTLELFGSTNGTSNWILLNTTIPSKDIVNVSVPVDQTLNYRYIKLLFTNKSNEVCVDDIVVSYGGEKTFAVTNQNVTAVSTSNVSGLTVGEKYYYTLNASSAHESALSSEIEVQLSTTPTWDGTAWAPSAPAAGINAVIADNYNGAGFACQNLEVNPGKQITIASGTLAVAGNLTLKSDASGTATFIANGTVTVTGTSSAQQYLSSARNWYVSSPISNAQAPTGFTYYGRNEAAATWPTVAAGAELSPGKGYIALPTTAGSTLTFSTQTGGKLNSGEVPVDLTYSGASMKGYNLIGNPYPSHLEWTKAFTDANVALIEPSIWYRTNAGTANNSGMWSYKTFNALSGLGTPSGTTGIIPPMQAVWVKAKKEGKLTLNSSLVRSHQTSNPLKAPTTTNTENKIVRLQVSNGNSVDEILIYFNANASDNFDAYDSPKMSNEIAAIPEIYTLAGAEKVAINGMKSVTVNQTIPLGFVTGANNSFSIVANQISNFESDIKVILKDNDLKSEFDLTEGAAYNFTSDIASTNDRFSIIFKSTSIVSANDFANDNNFFEVSKNENKQIVVSTNAFNGNATVTIVNSIGQKLLSTPIVNTTTVIDKSFNTGVYFVTMNVSGRITTKKIIIN